MPPSSLTAPELTTCSFGQADECCVVFPAGDQVDKRNKNVQQIGVEVWSEMLKS